MSMRKYRVGGSCFNPTTTPKIRSSRPVFSITSTTKCRAQACISTGKEPCISVITTIITGLSTAHVMRRVNPHHGGFLGDSFTPETPINSSVCYWEGSFLVGKNFDQNFQLRNTKEFNSSVNLLSSSFFPSLFEILFGQELYYSVHNLKRRFREDIDVHPVNEK